MDGDDPCHGMGMHGGFGCWFEARLAFAAKQTEIQKVGALSSSAERSPPEVGSR
jgi:hypothetical protein